MDANHFDTLAKQLAAPTTRRATLRAAAAGSLLSALGLRRAAPEALAAQKATCLLAFAASVRLGPSVDQVLTANGSRPGELRGELSFSLSRTGALEDAALTLPGGASLPVVGQATGNSLQVRIALAPRVALVAVGVGERAISECQGAIDGVVTGPQVGDLGDWHAASDQTGATSQTNSTDSGNGKTDGTKAKRKGGGAQAAPAGTTTEQTSRAGRSGGAPAADPTPPLGSGGVTDVCPSGLTRCGRDCVDLNVERNHCGACGAVCESGLVPVACRSGVCERADCAVGQEYCGAVDGCRDLQSDPDHCGGCQALCASGSCTNGVCTPAGSRCPTGQVECAGACVDLQTNPFHCGACATLCPGADTEVNPCIAGTCVDQCTAHGLGNCPGGCRDLASDAANCGACGSACTGGQVCQGGVCSGGVLTCAAGQTACGGVCVSLTNDSVNCGTCGNACLLPAFCCGGVCADLLGDAFNCGTCGLECAYGEICSAGVCQSSCAAGQSYCNGACVDTATDSSHCGFCNNPCGGFSQCVAGGCINTGVELPGAEFSCAAGLSSCNGACVDLVRDDLNCGTCGQACGYGMTCVGAACQAICGGQGLTFCNGDCVNTLVDDQHCGGCGNACTPGLICSGNGDCIS